MTTREFIPLTGYARNLSGQRFGRLLVIGLVGKTDAQKCVWLCQCDCGVETEVVAASLKNGVTKSCGCLDRELKLKKLSTPTPQKLFRSEYSSWSSMITRCTNENRACYKRYGGRGITVCDRWRDFKKFMEDMGPKPSPSHSIDRIDNNGNYCPENCRWATNKVQANNSTKCKMITYLGKTQSIMLWCEELNLKYTTTVARLSRGMSVQAAFTSPF